VAGTDRKTEKIINTCLEIDRCAAIVFGNFSAAAEDAELHGFWQEMASDEAEHLKYWKELHEMSGQGMVPQLFDDPGRIIDELEGILPRVKQMVCPPAELPSGHHSFLTAYRLEFFMMHSAFGTLFQLLDNLSDEITPLEQYDRHIFRLSDRLIKMGDERPELDLLGETLDRLWRENRSLLRRIVEDPLTGAFNRNGLKQTILPMAYFAQRNRHAVGVIMADIDDFKAVNDTHGHAAGDEVLAQVSARIRDSLRRSDVLVRFGGEEFLVFLPDVVPGTSAGVAEKIRKAVSGSDISGIPVTISLGVHEGVFEKEAENEFEEFVKYADAALYDAKNAGKNRVSGG